MNRVMRQTEQGGLAVEIFFNGQRHTITADRLQILNLLLSTYDAAIQRNKELTRAQEELAARGTVLAQRDRELHEAKVFLEDLIAASPSMIFRLEPAEDDFLVTYVSPNIGWVLGYGSQEVVGVPHFWRDIIHPDERETARVAFRAALEGMTAQIEQEYHWRAKDGTYRWFLIMKRVEYDEQGRSIAILCHALDITDRKQAQEQLRESEQRLRRIVDNMAAFVGEMTADGLLVDVNRPALEMGGLQGQDVIGKRLEETRWFSYSPAVQAQIREDIERALRGEVVRHDLDVRIAGDAIITIDFMLAPVRDAEGRVVKLIPSGVDITERKAAEEACTAAQLEAERANRAKSDFLSRMSHDLRTPLNAILGFAQLLKMDGLKVEQHDSVRHILKGGAHLLDLINEVLDLARIESGHLSLSPEPVAIADIVQHVVALVRPLAARRGITFDDDAVKECDNRRVLTDHVLADRQRLSQILMNLLSNAVKYNRDGGRVRVTCEDVPDGRIRIKVTDTGAGILPEKVKLLFQPFERLGADQTAVEGTGLGLALSKALAEAMGGTLGVESEVDRGSTFWVELARSEAPAETEAPVRARPDTSARDSGVTGTVLYIEDNISNRRLMERLLAHRPGVRLIEAPEGQAGLDLARAERPDLILLDLHLPDMSGDDVLRRLWEDARTRAIPVAVLSADATSAQMKRLLAAGATAYLTKPLDVGQVLQLLDERLAGTSGVDGPHAG